MEQKETSYKKKQPIKRPLGNKTFYLDLKMYPKLEEERLVKNLTLLGAKKEPVFSKGVSFVVSNSESLKSSSVGPFRMPPKPQNWTPLTPITNNTCQSPLFNESSMDYLNSPPYANSPVTDQNIVPMCRGMAILKKATLKKQPQCTIDLIEKCKQLNVKVLHVDSVVAQVEKLKNKFKVHYVAEKRRTLYDVRKLKPPFMKVEDLKLGKRSWSWYREFPSSTFNTKLADQVKELYNHFKKSGNIQVTIKPVFGETKPKIGLPHSPMAQPPVFTPSISKSFSKFSDTTAKPSTAFSVCNVKRKLEEQPPVACKKQKTSQIKKKKLYCEICRVNFVNLDRHLESETHRIFLSNPMNFLEVQNIITSFPKKEDFIMSRTLSSNVVQTCDLAVDYSCLPVDNFQVNPQEYPTTYGASADSHFYTSQQLALPTVQPVGDADTEPYCLQEGYVSPSCSSLESQLPFLEDSTDGLGRSTPLNLSNRERDIKKTPLGIWLSMNTLYNTPRVDTTVYDVSLDACQTEMGVNVGYQNSFQDSKLVNEFEQESLVNNVYDASQAVTVQDSVNVVTVDVATNNMIQLPNSFEEYGKCSTLFPTETIMLETMPNNQTSLIDQNDVIAEVNSNNIDLPTVSFTEVNFLPTNSAEMGVPPLEIVCPTESELIALPPKLQVSLNDSGFGTQNSPPPLPICCTAKEVKTESLELTLPNHTILKSSDQGSMPDLSIIEADASVLSSECMPVLVPVVEVNPYATENDVQACTQNPSPEHISQENKSKENLIESSPLPCVSDVHDNPVWSKLPYLQVRAETSKFCNDVVPSSMTSVYDLVEEADFSDTEECEWEGIQCDVNNLCDSFCKEEENDEQC